MTSRLASCHTHDNVEHLVGVRRLAGPIWHGAVDVCCPGVGSESCDATSYLIRVPNEHHADTDMLHEFQETPGHIRPVVAPNAELKGHAMPEYSIRTQIGRPYNEALAATKTALASEGFGVLTEIDVQATMKDKLGESMRPYVILGACNPPNAYRSLQAEIEIGLFLPCNVIVYESEPGKSVVAAINLQVVTETIDNPDLAPVAEDIDGRLRRVIEAVEAADDTKS
jgi:uncharacterized protein (DUF302 family)